MEGQNGTKRVPTYYVIIPKTLENGTQRVPATNYLLSVQKRCKSTHKTPKGPKGPKGSQRVLKHQKGLI